MVTFQYLSLVTQLCKFTEMIGPYSTQLRITSTNNAKKNIISKTNKSSHNIQK
uniref:Uncharacterized protein n=1 Tax=Anguilla anguilla TaxID=7936 RepID=A0A0E9XEI9_ANGAN